MKILKSAWIWMLLLAVLLFAVGGMVYTAGLTAYAAEQSSDEYATVYGDATKLTGLKAEYTVGEPIMVSAVGSGNAYVAIYKPFDSGSTYWHYIDTAKGGVGSGVEADLLQGNTLYPGTYVVRLKPEDGSHTNSIAWAVIQILPEEGSDYDVDALVQGDTSALSVSKSVYEVGEAIPVSAVGSGKDWVGIAKVGVQGSTKWHYIDTAQGGPGSGVEKDITQGASLDPGQYVIRVMPNNTSAQGKATAWAVITVGLDSEAATVYGAPTWLTGLKAEYTVGEPITVAAEGTGDAFVAIYRPFDWFSIYWHYVDAENGGVGAGVSTDLLKGNELYPGTYIVCLKPKDTGSGEYFYSNVYAWAQITVNPEEGSDYDVNALVQGDPTKLTVSESLAGTAVYQSGEPITVSAVGSGTDWVGIFKVGAKGSTKWHYIDTAQDGPGSGVATDITQYTALDPGEYVIRLMPDGTSNHGKALAWALVTVVEPDPVVPDAPVSATYQLDNDTDGYAAGTVTVTMPEYDAADRRDIVMYWADDNGKLEGYTALAKFKVTGITTTHQLASGMLIPAGATKLLVYSKHTVSGLLSETCITVELPDGAASQALGTPVMEFQVVSDIHVEDSETSYRTVNFKNMLEDVAANSPNSQGIMVVGDLANNGYQSEYERMMAVYNSVSGLPNMYIGIGNHDLWNHNSDIVEATELFCQYAKLPDGTNATDSSYDFWINGYHFVFLGTDVYDGLTASFEDATMEWLDATLAEDRSADRPTFVFLHQSMYDTIAGSLPGQGWDGVEEPSLTTLRGILSKYPEVLLFNGHSHWELDSVSCMYSATEELPINIFNTAAVAYLWTSYDLVEGVSTPGSQGYYLRVYEDKVLVLGKDFTTGEWVSSAQFCVELSSASEPLAFSGASVVLQDDLAVNFKVSASLIADNGYTDPYVVFSFNGAESTVTNYTVSGDKYVFSFRDIAPDKLGDTITATLYATLDGEIVASAARAYSVKMYCDNMMAKYSENEALCTLLADILHYGAAAQTYVGYQTDALVNSGVTGGTTATPALTDHRSESTDLAQPEVEWAGGGLLLEESIAVRLKFKAEDTEGLTARLVVDGQELSASSTFVAAGTDGQYYVYFKCFTAAQMRQQFQVTFYRDGVQVSNTLTYSMESYIHSKQSDANDALAALVIAAMKYGDSVSAYIG